MALTKEMWADPEFRKKMKEANLRVKQFGPRFKDTDPESYSEKGTQNRPYYEPLHKDWKLHKHLDTKPIEESIKRFCKKIRGSWIDQEPQKKQPTKINTEFNNGPLTFTKQKLEEWGKRQDVGKTPIDIPEEMI